MSDAKAATESGENASPEVVENSAAAAPAAKETKTSKKKAAAEAAPATPSAAEVSAAQDEEIADFDGDAVGAGASHTYPLQCSALRKNGHVVIKGRPCKIVDMSTSKTGKHGHAKVHLVATDIFTQKKLEDISPSTHNMEVPIVRKADFVLLDVDDEGFLTLLDGNGAEKLDIKIDTDSKWFKQIQEGTDQGKDMSATIVAAMGEEQCLDVKIGGNAD